MIPEPAYDLAGVRSRIPILQRLVPLNNCSQAPQSEPTLEAARAYLDSWAREGMDWEAWLSEVDAARAEFAALVGAEAGDVAVCSSVSHATAAVATGLDFTGRRHRVVVSAAEFPTVSHVWLAQERLGAEVAWADAEGGAVPLGAYEEVVDETTLVVSACTAWYQTGALQDIPAIAEVVHGQGALLYVDAYQTLGAGSFDAPASGADFVASGNLKFLMGIPGIAFLWVRPGVADELRPTITGWFGRADPFAFDARTLDWGPAARRLDSGTPPILEAYVARAGMAWLRELGLEAVDAWTATLGARLVEGGLQRGLELLGPTDPGLRAPTTAFACDDSHGVEMALRERGIIASGRGPALRLAPHFYNTVDDVDRALDALAEILGR